MSPKNTMLDILNILMGDLKVHMDPWDEFQSLGTIYDMFTYDYSAYNEAQTEEQHSRDSPPDNISLATWLNSASSMANYK